MAGTRSIAAAALSLERMITECLAVEGRISSKVPKAVLIRTDDFTPGTSGRLIVPPCISVFLYRVEVNRTMRAAWSAVGSLEGRLHLPLDLHFLMTSWAENPEDELRLLGRAMECLEATPILSGPLLHPSGDWAPNEAMQVVPEELSTEMLMRTFDSLAIDFRLSIPYLARVVRIDADALAAGPVTELVLGSSPSPLPGR